MAFLPVAANGRCLDTADHAPLPVLSSQIMPAACGSMRANRTVPRLPPSFPASSTRFAAARTAKTVEALNRRPPQCRPPRLGVKQTKNAPRPEVSFDQSSPELGQEMERKQLFSTYDDVS